MESQANPLAHITAFNSDQRIIETTFTGKVFYDEIAAAISESTSLAKTEQCYLWLTDYSAAEPVMSATEIYNLHKLFIQASITLNVAMGKIKRAIIISHTQADFEFAQTIANNRGESLGLFNELHAARKWLLNLRSLEERRGNDR